MGRLSEIRAELSAIAAAQEARASELLAHALRALEEVAGPDYAGRQAVKNEAARLKLILEREAPAFSRIIEAASS